MKGPRAPRVFFAAAKLKRRVDPKMSSENSDHGSEDGKYSVVDTLPEELVAMATEEKSLFIDASDA